MTIKCEMRVSGTVEFWFSRACNNLPAKYPQVALASLCSIFKSISKTKQLQLCLHKLLELKPSWTCIKALVLIINDEKSKCSTQEPSSFDLVISGFCNILYTNQFTFSSILFQVFEAGRAGLITLDESAESISSSFLGCLVWNTVLNSDVS